MSTTIPRTKLIQELRLLLGDQMVDVELDSEHYALSVDMAVERVRQRTTGGVEESHLFITLQPDVDTYTMPNEVVEVERLFRRGVGRSSTAGSAFDPFEASFSNIYLLQSGRVGGLATWDAFAQFQETVGRLFGSEINFIWEPSRHELKLIQRPKSEEDVLVKVWMSRPEDVILTDPYTGPWCREYALAQSKRMLGEARSKYTGGLPGAGGAVLLNGQDLKAEAATALEILEGELLNFVTGRDGMPMRIG